LIQKKQGFFCGWALLLFKPNLNQNAYIAVPAAGSATDTVRTALLLFRLVYLTWNKIDFQGLNPSGNPLTRGASILMLYLSIRCKMRPKPQRPVGRQNSQSCLTVKLC
jgi:hypothetical protein